MTAGAGGYLVLLCSERSGSNLLTRLFDAHPEVCGPSPTWIGSDLLANLQRYPEWWNTDREAFLNDFLDLFEAKPGDWVFQPQRAWLEDRLERVGPVGAYLALYREEACCHQKPRVFLRENSVYRWASMLWTLDEPVHWLYQVRDPRDMALSWKNAPALRGGVLRAAETWRRDQEGFLAFMAQLRAATGLAVPRVRYETLVDAPEPELRRLTGAVGLDFAPDMLRFHESPSSRRQAGAVEEWNNLASPLLRCNHGKYRDGLDPEEIAFVENHCRAPMAALGYRAEFPPLGDDELAKLEARLRPAEPWNKPAYARRPAAERARRARQNAVFRRIRERPVRVAD